MSTTVKVKKTDGKPESTEILASAIVSIGKAADKLLASGLNTKAVIVLLHYETKISQRDIKLILDSLKRLESWYCK
jgi:hypothetical protein